MSRSRATPTVRRRREPSSPPTSRVSARFSVLPPAASGWNWGAFFFTWIWGLFNGAYVTLWGLLLSFVPLGNLVWAIVCGVNGNRWAWQGKPWTSVEQFRSTQHKWAVAALIVFLVAVIGLVLLVLVVHAAGHGSATGAIGALPAASL